MGGERAKKTFTNSDLGEMIADTGNKLFKQLNSLNRITSISLEENRQELSKLFVPSKFALLIPAAKLLLGDAEYITGHINPIKGEIVILNKD